jgi:hypothetical protein
VLREVTLDESWQQNIPQRDAAADNHGAENSSVTAGRSAEQYRGKSGSLPAGCVLYQSLFVLCLNQAKMTDYR